MLQSFDDVWNDLNVSLLHVTHMHRPRQVCRGVVHATERLGWNATPGSKCCKLAVPAG